MDDMFLWMAPSLLLWCVLIQALEYYNPKYYRGICIKEKLVKLKNILLKYAKEICCCVII